MGSIPFALLVLSALLGSSLQSAMATETAPAGHPLAVVDGQPVTEQDILPLIRGKLLQLRTQEYQIKEDAVQDTIDQRLLEKAAKAKGVSVEKLLQQEVFSKVAEPSDHEVESFYEAQKSRIHRSLADIEPQIKAFLRSRKEAQARSDYLQALRAKANIKILLTPPRVQVGIDPARVLGKADAPVTVVEFSDYQCPFCKRALPVLKELLAKYPEKVRLGYRDFPLGSIHPRAEAAAEASRCAGEQGRFWPYHDLLFEHQTKLDDASLQDYARQLGMDAPRFEHCLKSHKYRAAVQQDLEKGKQLGISGTPAFFIDGIPLMGARPLGSFTSIIDQELARPSTTSTATKRQD
jgi:protein-disulfide isomerase